MRRFSDKSTMIYGVCTGSSEGLGKTASFFEPIRGGPRGVVAVGGAEPTPRVGSLCYDATRRVK